MAETVVGTKQQREPLTRRDLWKTFFRSFFIRVVCSPDRTQGLGFMISQTAVLEKYYTPEERAPIMTQYLNEYLSCHPMMDFWLIGFVIAIEEKIALGAQISRSVITSLKAALMGPFAAIGDSLYNGTLRPIVAGVCCTLALDGNAFAPILFVLIMAAVNLAIRISGIFIGYREGSKVFINLQSSGLLKKVIEAANMVAYTVVGSFASTRVSLGLAFNWVNGDGETVYLQDVLNGILPGILPLAFTLFTWWLISKKRANPIVLIMSYLAAGIALGYLGIIQ